MTRRCARALRTVTLTLAFASAGSLKAQHPRTPPAPPVRTYRASEVSPAAHMLAESPQPQYPLIMQRAGISGTVVAEFVVDTLGRADTSTFRIISAPHPLLAQVVHQTLAKMRFAPAQLRGRKVPQLVDQSFKFGPR